MRTEIPRQLVHLSGLLFVVLAQFIGKEIAILYFSLITGFFFIYSLYVRSQEKNLERFLHRMEGKFRDFVFRFERTEVKNPFTGAMLFYLGFTLTFVIFPFHVASAACAMLALGDSLATLIGKKLGRHKIGRKTFEGFLACLVGSLVAGVFFVSPFIAVAGAVTSALVELFPKANDNVTIPLFSGLVMFLLTLV